MCNLKWCYEIFPWIFLLNSWLTILVINSFIVTLSRIIISVAEHSTHFIYFKISSFTTFIIYQHVRLLDKQSSLPYLITNQIFIFWSWPNVCLPSGSWRSHNGNASHSLGLEAIFRKVMPGFEPTSARQPSLPPVMPALN